MAQGLINSETLDSIASAIQAKTGSSTPLAPSAMATAISNIPSGGGGDEKLSIPLTLFKEGATTTDIDNAFKFSDGKYLDINEYFSNNKHITKTATAPSAQTITTDVVYTDYTGFKLTKTSTPGQFDVSYIDGHTSSISNLEYFCVIGYDFYYVYLYSGKHYVKRFCIANHTATTSGDNSTVPVDFKFLAVNNVATGFPAYGKRVMKYNLDSATSNTYYGALNPLNLYQAISAASGVQSSELNHRTYLLSCDLTRTGKHVGITCNRDGNYFFVYQNGTANYSKTDVTNNTTLHYPLEFGASINFGDGVNRYFDFEGDYYDRAVTIV